MSERTLVLKLDREAIAAIRDLAARDQLASAMSEIEELKAANREMEMRCEEYRSLANQALSAHAPAEDSTVFSFVVTGSKRVFGTHDPPVATVQLDQLPARAKGPSVANCIELSVPVEAWEKMNKSMFHRKIFRLVETNESVP